MLDIIRPDTPVRITQKSCELDEHGNPITVDEKGHPIRPGYRDMFNTDILVEWKNKFGSEAIEAAANQAVEPVKIRLWYVPGVTADCRVVRVEDGAEFEIIGTPDDVMNRHLQLEIQLKRYTGG